MHYHVRWFLFIAPLALVGSLLSADDSVLVKNLTNTPLYAAVYYVKGKSNDGAGDTIDRATSVVALPANKEAAVKRPSLKTYGWKFTPYDRDLYVAKSPEQLAEKITKASLPFTNVGSKTDPFAITEVNGKLVVDRDVVTRDTVLVKNLTNAPAYVAVYYVPGKSSDGGTESITRATSVVTLPVNKEVAVERPGLNLKLNDRDLYVAKSPEQLAQTITKASLSYTNIGTTQGNLFYVTELGEGLGAFSGIGDRVTADNGITVFNETDKQVCVGMYYVPGASNDGVAGNAIRYRGVVCIPPHKSQILVRPDPRCADYVGMVCKRFNDRDLYVSYNQAEIKPLVPKGTLAWVNMGTAKGNEFYIAEENGELDAFNLLAWKARPIKQIIKDVGALALEALRAAYPSYSHKGETARVRQGTQLGSQEQAYRNARLPKVKAALEKLLGRTLADNQVPVIAFCGSGGGYRAMTSTLGFLQGAQATGLYDAALYQVGLSGSTWAIAGSVQSQLDLTSYIEQLKPRLAVGMTDGVSWDRVTLALAKKVAFGQKIGSVDLYGAILAEHLLTNLGGASNPQEVYLANQGPLVVQGQRPLPISTAILDITAPGDKRVAYEWVEFSPYEIGTTAFGGAFIPTWALGSFFDKGVAQEILPEQPLGYLMGIWGSAFTPNVKDALKIYQEKMKDKPLMQVFGVSLPTKLVLGALESALVGTWAAEQRAVPATVANWMKGFAGPVATQNNVILADAGIEFNIPVPPLLRAERAVSVIVILDASAEVLRGESGELRKAEAYCRARGLKFPPIDYKKAGSENCAVFEDANDPSCPVVVYMPLRKNPGYQNGWDPATVAFTQTSNFTYQPSETQLITGLTSYTMQQSVGIIKDALNRSIDRRSGKAAAVTPAAPAPRKAAAQAPAVAARKRS